MLVGINSVLKALRRWAIIIGIMKVIDLIGYIIGCVGHITPVSSVCPTAGYCKWSLAAKDIAHILDILVFFTSFNEVLIV